MNTVQGIAVILSLLALLGSGVGAYANLKAEMSINSSKLDKVEVAIDKLDNYDIYLQESISLNRESNIRLGTLMEGSEKSTQRLTVAIDKLLDKVDTLTVALYKLDRT